MKTESTVCPQLVERYPSLVRINYDVSERQSTAGVEEEAVTMYDYRMLEMPNVEMGLDELIKTLVIDKYPLEEQVAILADGSAADVAELKDFMFRCKGYAMQILGLPVTERFKEEERQMSIKRIDAQTDLKILNGFKWTATEGEDAGKTFNVWLSAENQRNYSEGQRVALMTNGQSLPVEFKLGEEDGIPQYHTFSSLEELTSFYLSAVAYIQQCLNEGWREKDAAAEWVDSLEL